MLVQLFRNPRIVQKVPVPVSRLFEDLLQHIGDVISTNDTAVSPYLNHFRKIDLPLALLVCLIDDVEPLHKGSKKGFIDGFSEIFEKGLFLCFGMGYPFDGEMATEYFIDLLAIFAEGGSYSDIVGVGECGSGDVKADCF